MTIHHTGGKRDPLLRTATTSEWRSARAHGGLHMIRGNGKPHFSLTGEFYPAGQRGESGAVFGCCHDEILSIWPELKPLADLHLSDIDGVPMHASANAFYWLAGASPKLRNVVPYHGGNSTPARDEEACAFILASHLRISLDDANALALAAEVEYMKCPQYRRVYERGGIDEAKAVAEAFVEAQRPRWKQEAERCIRDLNLVIYGDPYTQEAA